MIHLALPSKLRLGTRSFSRAEDFSMKRVTVWALVFAEAFFVGALIGRAFLMLKM
jgi:hypothetical protein